jgi:hypothetical protein
MIRASKYPGSAMQEGKHQRMLGELRQPDRTLKRGRLAPVRVRVEHDLPEWFGSQLPDE